MNVSLYEISADFLKALDGLEVDEETGEIMNFDSSRTRPKAWPVTLRTCQPSPLT